MLFPPASMVYHGVFPSRVVADYLFAGVWLGACLALLVAASIGLGASARPRGADAGSRTRAGVRSSLAVLLAWTGTVACGLPVLWLLESIQWMHEERADFPTFWAIDGTDKPWVVLPMVCAWGGAFLVGRYLAPYSRRRPRT